VNFEQLGLDQRIVQAVDEAGYSEPTPIQSMAIPKIIEGVDIRASAYTGTGKTAAFVLPALTRLASCGEKSCRGPRILVLVPTRELAMQVASQVEKYGRHLPRAKVVCIIGGVPYPVQRRRLSRPYDILIATPGRLIDYLDRRKITLSSVEMLVLDEADRMLDMGFIEPVEQIAEAVPGSRQTLLFSATLGGSIKRLSDRLMTNPIEIVAEGSGVKPVNIEQILHYTDDLRHKKRLLNHLLNKEEVSRAIVFTATKRQADELVDDLYEEGLFAAALHGDMNQRQRTKTIDRVRNGRTRILVATDVAARGIDVQAVTHVINFDLPHNVEDYVHRIGRTGRAGASGIALSFAARREASLVKRIEQFIGKRIDAVEIPGFEPKAKQSRSSRPFPGARAGSRRSTPSSKSGFASRHWTKERAKAQRKRFQPSR